MYGRPWSSMYGRHWRRYALLAERWRSPPHRPLSDGRPSCFASHARRLLAHLSSGAIDDYDVPLMVSSSAASSRQTRRRKSSRLDYCRFLEEASPGYSIGSDTWPQIPTAHLRYPLNGKVTGRDADQQQGAALSSPRKIRGSTPRNRRSATRQSGTESRISGESTGRFPWHSLS
jgi:hypothetical protein